jgi:hypothetical protein
VRVLEGRQMATYRKEISPITDFVGDVFAWMKAMSPMMWLSVRWPLLGPRTSLSETEYLSDAYTKARARAVDFYLLVCFGTEAALVLIALLRPPLWWSAIAAFIACIRVVEILQVTINASLFDQLRGRSDSSLASHERSVTLTGLNYLELIICFGLVYATDIAAWGPHANVLSAFYFSICTQLTVTYGDLLPIGWFKIVVAVQSLIAFLFLIVVLSRFIGSLTPAKGILSKNSGHQE